MVRVCVKPAATPTTTTAATAAGVTTTTAATAAAATATPRKGVFHEDWGGLSCVPPELCCPLVRVSCDHGTRL